MARIILGTFGSLGDLHPALALALELRQRGHRAEIVTSEFYREKITTLGLGFHSLRPNFVVDEALVRKLMDGNRGSRYLLCDLIFPAVRDMHADLAAAAAGADCLVASELIYGAPIIAAKTGLPWVSYSLAPISLFSVFDPPLLPGPPGMNWLQSLGPLPNRVLRVLAKAATHSWWKPLRDLRHDLGLPAGGHPLFEGKYSPRLDLALFSSVLQAPQADWPASTVQCGFPFYDEPGSAPTLPKAVADFLAAGPPPIVFTLGSSAVFTADDFFARSADAAQRLGRRALLLMGKNPPPAGLPESILAWDYLPYAQIFPHAAAIVHQGGVGTTGQALRAGKPMLVMPFAHDQPDNAARVARLGLARTIGRSSYTAAKVARELAWLLETPACAQRATEVGARVRAEGGVTAACDAIERQLR